MKKTLLIICLLLLYDASVYAWLYPEHRDIILIAIHNLAPDRRSTLDNIWADARIGYENRLTPEIIDPNQNTDPKQLDYAAWPAIGGDHSCSPENMLNNVLQTDWILEVAAVAAQLKIDLSESNDRSERINAIRD